MSETALQSGDVIETFAQIDELPVGSVICEVSRPETAWRKEGDGLWHGIDSRAGNGPHTAEAFSMSGYNMVRERNGTPPPQPPPDTLMQFMWKFRENAISGARENSVSMDATMKGMRLLGLDIEWELGPGVPIKALDDNLPLPEGVVAANAAVPDPKDNNYSLFVRKRRSWSSILGRSGLGRDLVIVDYPGVEAPPAWWAEVGNEETAKQVAHFKARAWRIGNKIKSEQSWCGTYEHVIARVGVTARSIREAQADGGGYDVGDTVSQVHAAAMPEGTLFLYRSETWADHWAVYQRDNTSDNLTRTRRVAGHRNLSAPALGNYQSTMTILSLPIEGMTEWTVEQPHVPVILAAVPIGTVFTYSGTRYIKCQNIHFTDYREGRGIPERGVHNSRAFSGDSIIINHFEEQS